VPGAIEWKDIRIGVWNLLSTEITVLACLPNRDPAEYGFRRAADIHL